MPLCRAVYFGLFYMILIMPRIAPTNGTEQSVTGFGFDIKSDMPMTYKAGVATTLASGAVCLAYATYNAPLLGLAAAVGGCMVYAGESQKKAKSKKSADDRLQKNLDTLAKHDAETAEAV